MLWQCVASFHFHFLRLFTQVYKGTQRAYNLVKQIMGFP
ncbi:hypothetical protein DespoDRAFT_02490 [Desulfobacter postgatei 2ac9]|uniref:Uncharacterized protein n=1 Tax=Desulfobacter postgatei 2ac9 TaxID=879212 RepID=I5B4C5_9BACT|nr:hypothetical protein DespoDRAFT_02490 [Desulfobacter postgatei 2ac9]